MPFITYTAISTHLNIFYICHHLHPLCITELERVVCSLLIRLKVTHTHTYTANKTNRPRTLQKCQLLAGLAKIQ